VEKSGGVVEGGGECGDDVVCMVTIKIETKFIYFIGEERSKAVGERDTWGRPTER